MFPSLSFSSVFSWLSNSGFGPWFVVLHPVNYVAENWKLLGMWVSIRWPRDTHSLCCWLCVVRSHSGKLEVVGALGAGTEPVALSSSLEISVSIFRGSALSLLIWFGCLSSLQWFRVHLHLFPSGVEVNSLRLVFPVVILEDLGIIPGASVGNGEVLAAAWTYGERWALKSSSVCLLEFLRSVLTQRFSQLSESIKERLSFFFFHFEEF